MSEELLRNNIIKAEQARKAGRELVRKATMRQNYHFMAEAGWLNDPNGLIFFGGKYHFFYQYNPYGSFWGEMHWGHAISDDLIHWEYLPIALAPSEVYDAHPQGGCFSGSAIEYEGQLYLMYTGTANYGNGLEQTQCLAVSKDGVNFVKSADNPVIRRPPEGVETNNFRDPKVWRHNGKFYMVCGGKRSNLAVALLYTSDNLRDWRFVNFMAESRGEWGNMWECPDFYQLGNKYVLTFSPMGVHERKAVYLVGDMNYDSGKFIYQTVGEIDWGFDFYAPQSFVDKQGRRLMVGWANGWEWMPWWQDWGPTYKEGWCGSFSLPREVRLCENNTLQFIPIAELNSLRGREERYEELLIMAKRRKITANLGSVFELQLWIDLKKTTAETFDLYLQSDDLRETVIHFDLKQQMMGVNRSKADGWSKGMTKSPLIMADREEMHIHIYADTSSVEIFTDHYQTVHSVNRFANHQQQQNWIAAVGGKLYIQALKAWPLAAGKEEKDFSKY